MATGVGLRIADDECLAAIVSGGSDDPGEQTSEPYFLVREPVLHMSEDGDTELGGDPPTGTSHSITGFASAVGDPAGIRVDDGEAYRAEDLLATALFCLIDQAAAHLSGPAEFYAVHPADWPAAQVLALRDALDYLGLRSVVLISAAILPSAQTGRELAAAAARSALDSVLSTPAGTTPPDPSRAENPLESTDVLPAIREPEPQAYSAAIPIERPATTPPPAAPAAPPASPAPPPTRVAPVVTAPPATNNPRRTPILIAAAAAIGLLLGGIAVALLLGGNSSDPGPSVPDARSDLTTTFQPPTTTTIPPPPPPITHAPITTHAPIRRTVVPPPHPPTTTHPHPTTTTTPPAPTTTETTSPDPSGTSTPDDPWDTPPTQSPYYPYTFDPYPTFPTAPNFGFPSAGIP